MKVKNEEIMKLESKYWGLFTWK